ncbi:YbaN family protein [Roseitranquillus sediminis]|uniref:YbaN family protein n=1 Tax=Roseitranquillus sediminis TaxID=2809051 RepID=UPI001D0C64BA|nr:YbaN family protein [Roseitranquillus sediminis]MBM9593827.1 YbaN family protein [Roseitranquillus sediminis]
MDVRRIAWLTLGFGATALGIIGLFLPVMPTTPFLLLAAVGFSRSSPRMHDWLTGHPRYGAPIRNWQRHGAIAPAAKAASVAAMAGSLVLGLLLGLPAPLIAVQGVVLALVAVFILTRPIPPRE